LKNTAKEKNFKESITKKQKKKEVPEEDKEPEDNLPVRI